MSSGYVACAGCTRFLPPDYENAGEFVRCPSCLEEQRVFAFPTLRRAGAGVASAQVLSAGDASCFYHTHKQAVVECGACGRFLCALCDVEIGGAHRCPGCLESGKQKGTADTIENRRTLYDGLALALAIVPVLVWPVTLLTAPATLFVVVRYWRRPLSILPRTRVRFVIAALTALAQICGWIALFYFVFARIRTA